MVDGTEGRGTDGAGSPGIIEEQSREAGTARSGSNGLSSGTDTDGPGTAGMVQEQSLAGRRGTTAFEHGEGHDTDGAGSGGILDKEPVDFGEDAVGASEGPSTGLQTEDSESLAPKQETSGTAERN